MLLVNIQSGLVQTVRPIREFFNSSLIFVQSTSTPYGPVTPPVPSQHKCAQVGILTKCQCNRNHLHPLHRRHFHLVFAWDRLEWAADAGKVEFSEISWNLVHFGAGDRTVTGMISKHCVRKSYRWFEYSLPRGGCFSWICFSLHAPYYGTVLKQDVINKLCTCNG